jgi:endonuclease V-like protein UPF0215 family
MHIAKTGLRVLGIAESFRGHERSTLAGVVMRRDLLIDGVAFAEITVGGMDATDGVLAIVSRLHRRDINCLMLGGCVIAWYNIIDPARVAEETGLPVIVVTYEESEGLADDIRHHFPGDLRRVDAYLELGERVPLTLSTGQEILIRAWNLPVGDAARICDAFTHQGKVPEPVRVARLIARARMRLGSPVEKERA